MSHLVIPFKVFERFPARMIPIIEKKNLVTINLEFPLKATTIEQIHIFMRKVNRDKRYCSIAFLNVPSIQ